MRLDKVERSEAKMIDEVKLLRNQLEAALDKNDVNEKRIEDLEEENGQIKEDNASFLTQNASDKKSVGSLKKDNKDLTA